jgi:hypothetical protein
MPTPIIKGIATIIWGIGNGMNAPAGALIESIQVTPKNGNPIEIEDNNGFAISEILLVDGFDAKLNCVYDSAKVWPLEGSNVTLNLPMATGNNSNATTAFVCLVASQAPALKRKGEAMIAFNMTYRPGVSV